MIRQVRVENYKNLNGFDFGGFKRLNLLTGKNNIGKTNLLEALHIGLHPSSKGFVDVCEARQIRISSKNISILDNIFSARSKKYVEIIIDDLSSKVSIDEIESSSLERIAAEKDQNATVAALLEKIENSLLRKMSSKEIHFLKNNNEVSSIFPIESGIIQQDRLSEFYISSVIYIPSSYKVTGKELSDIYSETVAKNREKKQTLMKLLNNCLKLNIEDISILTDGGEPNIHLSVANNNSTVPLQYFGDATRKSFDILMKCMSLGKGGVALIDEVENGLYYKNQQDFWNALNEISKQTSCQIVATTHSLEMINAFYEATKDEQDCGLLKMYRDRKSENISISDIDKELLEYELRKISGLYDVDILR